MNPPVITAILVCIQYLPGPVEKDRKGILPVSKYILGNIFLSLVQGENPVKLTTIIKNMGFIVKHALFAAKLAEQYLNDALETAKALGAVGIMGQTYLSLGLLYKKKNRKEDARECLKEAIRIFEEIDATVFLGKAKEERASLN